MTDTATIEALEAAIARAEDECPNAPYVPVKIELAKQSASTIRALSAENERMRAVMGDALEWQGWASITYTPGNAYEILCQALKEADTTRAIEKGAHKV